MFLNLFLVFEIYNVDKVETQIWLLTRYETFKNLRILLYSLLPNETYYNNLGIWIFLQGIWANLGFFFPMKNPFYMDK
jgi:hypothetical protein